MKSIREEIGDRGRAQYPKLCSQKIISSYKYDFMCFVCKFCLFFYEYIFINVQLNRVIEVQTSVAKANRFLSPPDRVFLPSRPPILVNLEPYSVSCRSSWFTRLFLATLDVRRSMRRFACQREDYITVGTAPAVKENIVSKPAA